MIQARFALGGAVVAAVGYSTAMAAPTAFHTVVAGDAPVLWYKFDEAPGATAAVNSGSLGAAFNGVFHNGVTLGAPTVAGDRGVLFHGAAQQYVESAAPAPASLTGNPSFTAEAVVRVTAAQTNFGYPPFLHWGAPTTGRSVYFSLWTNAIDRGYVGFYNGGLRMVNRLTPTFFVHLVWVRDAAGGANGQHAGTTLYVNGQAVPLEIDTILVGAPVIDVTSTTFTVQRATDGVRYFSGTVDEVVLYNRLLTAQEVAEHAAALNLPCPGDLNGDGQVSTSDLTVLLGNFGRTVTPYNAGDFTGDGMVTTNDLTTLLGLFGSSC